MKYVLQNAWKIIVAFSAICSITSILAFILQSTTMAIIALSIFCLFLISIIIILIWFLSKYITTKYHDPYHVNFVYLRYTTEDSNIIESEVYKSIHCKRYVISSCDFGFKWTGERLPRITSKLQRVDESINQNPHDYDKVKLYFSEPLLLNQSEIIHLKTEMDDSDHKSKTHIEVKITNKTRIVHYRVELRYKDANYDKPAKFMKRKIDNPLSSEFTIVEHVPFRHKTYEYQLLNPEIGYYYRLAWDR